MGMRIGEEEDYRGEMYWWTYKERCRGDLGN